MSFPIIKKLRTQAKDLIYEVHQETAFYFVILAAFLVRIYNINYNSAFNDEAIYVVIGRMGVFASDWYSYGANLWMAGQPYIYPVISALAYHTGGLLASRLLNIIFGTILVEEVYRFTKLISLFDKKSNMAAAVYASFVAAFSGVGIYVSKLATYDIGSFLLMMLAINSFLKSGLFQNGKYYFLAFLSLVLAFLTKIIIAIFYPPLLLISLLLIAKRSPPHKKLALVYFYIPLVISLGLYFSLNFSNLMTYITTHRELGLSEGYLNIIQLIWKVIGFGVIAGLFSTLFLIKAKKVRLIFSLWMLVITVPLFHLALKRYATLDKHLYLSVVFLSPLIGYGITEFIRYTQKIKTVSYLLILTLSFLYLVASGKQLDEFQTSWQNTYQLEKFLQANVKTGEKILTENGGAVILSLYDTLFPPGNIFTFDWIDYAGLQEDKGYEQAMSDLYFDYIELDNQFEGKDEIKENIRSVLQSSYTLVYKEGDFEVYKRKSR